MKYQTKDQFGNTRDEVSNPTKTQSSDNSGDFLTSAVVGYATNSALLGGVIGGDFAGGIVGDAMNGGFEL